MPISDRVQRLRNRSLNAEETLSSERAEILTQFHKKNLGGVSIPVQRALSFKYLLAHQTIFIGEDELIVGEKGPAPKQAPTYPELCCHSLEDLHIVNTREKISFKVDKKTRTVFKKVILPFWSGKSMRDRLFNEMREEWKNAYEAGIFTEFMEQRAPGHTVLDEKIYHKGMLEFITDIKDSIDHLNFLSDPGAYDKKEELRAMAIAAEALILFARRHAALARELAEGEIELERREELFHIAEICEWVPGHVPRDFWEALQYYWFVHLGVTIELNTWDSFNPGHLDQHLDPFYQSGLVDGSLTRDQAEELLQCLWIKFNNQPAPPKVGITAAESGTYTDFAQINLGGVDADGFDAVNEVTYLLLDVIEGMRLLQPSSSIHVSKKSPDRFIKRAAQIVRTGFGQPSIFNSDLIVQELVRTGKSIEDARRGGSSGCVEVGAFGKEAYILTGYFNLPKILELTLHNGYDPRTSKQLGPKTGDTISFETFENLFLAFEKQVKHFIDVKIRGNNIIERLYALYLPAPFLSLLIDDCIQKGLDYHSGGARYNTSYIQGVGLGSVTDSLSAIKTHVFDKKTFTLHELLDMLAVDYAWCDHERYLLMNKTPHYGNDQDEADQIMQRVFEIYYQAIEGRKNLRGGEYHINLLPTTVHIYFGSVTGALPDGRKAFTPLSEGISPVQGADRLGPTAVLKSASKMDQVRTGGTLLNLKFTPSLLKDEEGLDGLVHLVRGYFQLDGHHVQFNVVDAETLRKAQINPEQYRDLIVRVAGYSDYFCDLSHPLQEEIISRTEHTTF